MVSSYPNTLRVCIAGQPNSVPSRNNEQPRPDPPCTTLCTLPASRYWKESRFAAIKCALEYPLLTPQQFQNRLCNAWGCGVQILPQQRGIAGLPEVTNLRLTNHDILLAGHGFASPVVYVLRWGWLQPYPGIFLPFAGYAMKASTGMMSWGTLPVSTRKCLQTPYGTALLPSLNARILRLEDKPSSLANLTSVL